MKLEYYLFAFFIFCLLCMLVTLCRVLFSDVKRQRKLLDEKEGKLLRLYSGLEDAMEEFNDAVEATKAEWESQRKLLQSMIEQVKEGEHRSVDPPSQTPQVFGRRGQAAQRSSNEGTVHVVRDEQSRVQIDKERNGVDALIPADRQEESMTDDTQAGTPKPLTRHESILDLAEKGTSRNQIAKTLGITQNEVDLVIGIER